jgi:hypothetical protein
MKDPVPKTRGQSSCFSLKRIFCRQDIRHHNSDMLFTAIFMNILQVIK